MRLSLAFCLLATLCSAAACGGDGNGAGNENEVITTVTLTFTPSGGGTAIVAAFDDPDGDGGEAPTIDPIALTAGGYDLTVKFENRLEDPAEDITVEVMDESDEHQLFFIGTAVNGPAATHPGAPLTHAYADEDANGLPIGLDNTITAAAGTGVLTVVLRHMPPVNEEPVKVADTAAQVAAGGLEAIGGTTDAKIDFDVTVQ